MINEPLTPNTLRLADGTDVPHEIGVSVFNYYDMKAGRIERRAERAEPDTSGKLPNGLAWWVDVRHDDGTRAFLDGSRLMSIGTAIKRGWLDETTDWEPAHTATYSAEMRRIRTEVVTVCLITEPSTPAVYYYDIRTANNDFVDNGWASSVAQAKADATEKCDLLF